MTDLMNGYKPTDVISKRAMADPDAGHAPLPQTRPAGRATKTHPNQTHLNALIHAKVVTHMIHVDEGPDPLFALSQMQGLPEVKFAAVFDDGLIALGCPGTLPEALATIATPAVPTAPPQPSGSSVTQRMEKASRRLETMIDAMEPEQAVLDDQLGRSILDRLTSLETQMAKALVRAPDTASAALKRQVSQLQEQITALPDPSTGIALLDAKLADITQPNDLETQFAKNQKQLEAISTSVTEGMSTIKDVASRVEVLASGTTGKEDDSGSDTSLSRLTDQIARLERSILSTATPAQNKEIEKSLRNLTRAVESSAKVPPETSDVMERVEQLGLAQRSAFTRIEAAMIKAVSGLEPALDHLNARVADTENMMSDWQKDLKTLSLHTRSIADNTGKLPPVFAALQSDLTALANKPAPVLDLSSQTEGFARFGAELSSTLNEIESFAQQIGEKSTRSVAQSDKTIATLQTLPNLISATLRHDVDLKPIEHSLSELQSDLGTLSKRVNLTATNQSVTTLADQIAPISDNQKATFDSLQSTIKIILAQLQNLSDDVTGLHTPNPDLALIKDQVGLVQQQLKTSTQDHDGEFGKVRDTLCSLSKHLGLTEAPAVPIVASSELVPEASLNTLRMEFADLITKRIKENNKPIAAHSRKA